MKVPTPAQKLMIAMCDGYNRRDLPFLMTLFTKDSNMWGTGKDEHRVGLKAIEDQFKRDWSQAEKSSMEVVTFIPSYCDDLWAAATLRAKVTVEGQEHVFEDLRGTLNIKQEEGKWKISHSHASFPDMRNPQGNSFPVGE
jgi:ketosteroid isomerase-like protein